MLDGMRYVLLCFLGRFTDLFDTVRLRHWLPRLGDTLVFGEEGVLLLDANARVFYDSSRLCQADLGTTVWEAIGCIANAPCNTFAADDIRGPFQLRDSLVALGPTLA